MKLESGHEYELTVRHGTVYATKYIMKVGPIYHDYDFFCIDFFSESDEFVSTTYYTQKMVNDLVSRGKWRIVQKGLKVKLDDDLFLM